MSGERVDRRLTAILAADVAGYSRLVGADEEGTVARLRALRTELINPTMSGNRGRVFHTAGDSVLAEFGSVVDAVRAALDVQRAMMARNADFAPEKRIKFRIGIHLGDVMVESDGDLMGDGVNIAARLEAIARPGTICLSEDAYRQIRGRLDLAADDLGEQSLKNIAERVRVYSLAVDGVPAAAKASSSPRRRSMPVLAIAGIAALIAISGCLAFYFLSGQKPATVASTQPPLHAQSVMIPRLSIVVLPFANLSGDPNRDYFADGITENLTSDLSRLAGSFVIARNTAFTYKSKNVDAKQIGEELGVRYVLEGSVQRDGHQVRVNVQLIDAETGGHLWADRFDRDEADLFKVEDEIVARLANQLRVELVAAEARRAAKAPNPDATDLYFQGLAWYNKGPSRANLKQARTFFERALAHDPADVDALLGRAAVDLAEARDYSGGDRTAHMALAEAALTKALSVAPNNARAHYELSTLKTFSNRAGEGVGEAERALALDRNLAAAHSIIGAAKIFLGHPEEAEAHIQEALRLSPRDLGTAAWMATAGGAKLHLGAYEEAVAWEHRAIEANPNFALSHFFLAAALGQLGRLDEARAAVKAGLTINPDFTIAHFRAETPCENATCLAREQNIYDGLRKAGVPDE